MELLLDGELVDKFPILYTNIDHLYSLSLVQFNSFFIGLLILWLFFGCSSEQENATKTPQADNTQMQTPDFSSISTSDVFVYECGDSLQFTAHVTSDSTWLFLPDTTLKVMPVPSGSGAKFEGSLYIYWSKNDEALLQLPEGALMSCTSLPQERSWESARLRGVDFRALGQEPGWHLEIIKDERIKYVGNYGEDTVYVPVPDPQTDQQHTVYRTETEDHKLEVEIIDEPCVDSMSGAEFPSSVSVTVDGETYRGCGRELS